MPLWHQRWSTEKQVKLTTALTKELDSTMEEVEFWQENYEEAMKTIENLKCHYFQGLETLSEGPETATRGGEGGEWEPIKILIQELSYVPSSNPKVKTLQERDEHTNQ
jgi:hypothetical protein